MFKPTHFIYDNIRATLTSAGTIMVPDKTTRKEHYMSCLTGVPHPFGNLVVVGELPDAEYHRLLAELEHWTQKHSAPIGLILFSHMGAAEKGTIAEQRNWILMETMPGMWMDIPDDFVIGELIDGASLETVNDEESLANATKVLTEGYPVPHETADFFMRGIQLAGEADSGSHANFLITFNGEVAACSSVCIHENVAGIYCVATLEPFRGKGLGAAVTRAAVAYARQRGVKHALLHATEMGESIYKRIGFEQKCRVPAYGFGLEG